MGGRWLIYLGANSQHEVLSIVATANTVFCSSQSVAESDDASELRVKREQNGMGGRWLAYL